MRISQFLLLLVGHDLVFEMGCCNASARSAIS
jgi:hypothetical protein